MANNLRYKSGDVVGERKNGIEVFTWRIRYLPTLELMILTVQSSLMDAWEGRERIQSKTDISSYSLDPDFMNSEYIQFLADNAALNAKQLNQSDYVYNKYIEQTNGTIIPIDALKQSLNPKTTPPPSNPPPSNPPPSNPPPSNTPGPVNTGNKGAVSNNPLSGNTYGIPNSLIIGSCALLIFVLVIKGSQK